MLLKYSQAEKRTKGNVNGKQRATGAMKLAVGVATPRLNRKVMKGITTKRNAAGQQRLTATERAVERTTVDPCDNSNDSGLGFDHHLEFQLAAASTLRFADQETSWANEHSEVKRKKLEIKLESDDANDNFTFPETMSRRDKRGEETDRLAPGSGEPIAQVETAPTAMSRTQTATARRSAASSGVSLTAQYLTTSRDSKTQLRILCQPEQQHRARYQTEGSRGAVKDRTGNGFPVVQLVGYNKPATLQVFIGTDMGRVAPHMFYQACRVSGKNSTPCLEKKIDGTIVIEVDFDPAKDMVITCDCVGILKERNVDVEHRFPDHTGSRTKKKSTRCRMVFRTTITNADGSSETLQSLSNPIVCTQPPGLPEICKKSLTGCPCTGGMELFILGKNFLKETRVLFKNSDAPGEAAWEEVVHPDKEFLQSTHLVCVVPPYQRVDLTEPVTVRLQVISSGKLSEPHSFTYTPVPPAVVTEGTQPCVSLVQSGVSHNADVSRAFAARAAVGLMLPEPAASSAKTSPKKGQYLAIDQASVSVGDPEVRPVMMWQTPPVHPPVETQKPESSEKMMPPPLLPIATRRPSSSLRLIVPDSDPGSLLATNLKTELVDDTASQSPEDTKGIDLRMKPVLATVADLASTQCPTMATLRRFVTGGTNAPLPTQSAHSVEKYLSRLEHSSDGGLVSKPAPQYDSYTPETSAGKRFVNDLPLPLMYNAAPQEAQRKVLFNGAAPLTTSSPESMLAGRRPLVVLQESQTVDARVSGSSALVESLDRNVSILNTDASALLSGSSATLVYDAAVTREEAAVVSKEREAAVVREASLLPGLGEQMLAAVTESSIIAPTLMPGHVLASETAETQKLDALVNSAAVSHMMTAPITMTENVILNTPVQQEVPVRDRTSPVKKMSGSGLGGFGLVSATAQNAQLLTVALNEHLQAGAMSVTPSSGNTLYASHDRTSPIAVKNMILSSSAEDQLHPPHTSPVAVKNMILGSSTDGQLHPPCTSPVAVKNMILGSSPDGQLHPPCTSPVAVKNMILGSSPDGQLHPPCTSPVAVKSLVLGSPDALPHGPLLPSEATSPIAMKEMVVEASSENQMLVTSSASSSHSVASDVMPMKSMMLESIAVKQMMLNPEPADARLDALVQSTLTSHSLVPTVPSTTGDALLGSMFRSPTDSGHASQFTTASTGPQSLLTGITMPSKVAEELAARTQASSTGYVTEMLLGLAAEEKLKKESEAVALPESRLFEVKKQESQGPPCKQPHTTGTAVTAVPGQPPQKKAEEGMVPQELTQMSENDLLSYINPSTFDQV